MTGVSSLLRSVGAVEPVANRLALRLIEQQMKLGAAEQKVLSGHGVLDLGNMNQLGLCHASSDLLRKVRIAQHLLVEPLDLVAIGEGPAMAGFTGKGSWA